MDQELTRLLVRVRESLSNNANIRSVFRAEDCRAGYFQEKNALSFLQSVPRDELWEHFRANLNYLITYIEGNDVTDGRDMVWQDDLFDLYHCVLRTDHHINSAKEAELTLQVCVLLLMLSVTSYIEKDIATLITENLDLLYGDRDRRPGHIVFYRGHSNQTYKLLPSMFRGYRSHRYGNPLTYSTLYKLYKETGLLNKYTTIFTDFKKIDTRFCAYMQHSTSFSPFLDISEDHRVALSFATQLSGNRNEYLSNNAALFRFEFPDKALTRRSETGMEDMQIDFINDRFHVMTLWGKKELWRHSPESFTPTIDLIADKSNDRMRYQKGAFLFFRRAVVVNSQILLPYTIGNVQKYIIPANRKSLGKQVIYNSVKGNYPHYDSEHLMDPYLIFAEN